MSIQTNDTIERGNSHQRYFWWLLTMVWLILSLFMASQIVGRTEESAHPIGWYNAIMLEVFYCAQWIALAPATLWLARKFPLKGRQILYGVIIHLIAGTSMAAVTMAGRTVLNWIFLTRMATELTVGSIVSNLTIALDYGIMSYLLNVLFCYSFVFYNQVREREMRALKLEAELGKAQLLTLKMQLHPHFFFNTLNTISVLIRKQENELAVDMIARLSKFLRYTLEKTDTQELTLQEELNGIDLYLEIQKVRFQDSLTVRKSIAADALTVRVPTLILQPLVENALQHGIAMRTGGGELELSAERRNGALHIRISDNGPGIKESISTLKREGIGLQNSESRLMKLYGSASALNIQSGPEGGTSVEVVIPIREETS